MENLGFRRYSELDHMLNLGDIGIVKVYPFNDLKNSPLQNEEWEMRLLNAGELLEVFQVVRGLVGRLTDDELQMQKMEMFIRSVIRRNGKNLVSDKDVETYNQTNNRVNDPISLLDLLRMSVRNLEQYMLNAFDLQYQRLLQKQENYILGLVICANCGKKLLKSEITEVGLIRDFDEVDYCPSCPDREEVIRNIADKMRKGESPLPILTGETLAKDIDLETSGG
jgi:hypothetical protein